MPAFTVNIAGPERHEGHACYTFVVEADDLMTAAQRVIAHFKKDVGSDDVELLGVIPGVPAKDCGYYWNDLRSAPHKG